MRYVIMLTVALATLGATVTMATGETERRAWYPNGQLSEVRRFKNGREEGLQQAWTEDGTIYMNYEMRNGRRYGLFNARPCAPVEKAR